MKRPTRRAALLGLATALMACGDGGGGGAAAPTPTPTPTPTPSPTPSPPAPAELLVNGDFEQPAIADGTLLAADADGWNGGVLVMNPNAAGAIAGNVFTWPQAASGQQYRDIGNTPSTPLSQRFTLASAGSVTLGWQDNTALGIAPGFQAAPYRVTLTDAAAATVYSADFDAWRASGAWQVRSVTLSLAAGQHTLTIASQNLSNRTDTLIDGVSALGPP